MDYRVRFKEIFEEELILEIERKTQEFVVPEGTVLLDVGQFVKTIPIVLNGSLKISRLDENGHELLLYYVNPAQSCAMTFTCCMEQFPSEIRSLAEEETTYIAVPIALMDEWMMRFPTWKSFVMKTIRARLNELLNTIHQLAFLKLDERLYRYLDEKMKSSGSSLINLSHEQIAKDLASSREVISRLLKRFENENRLLLYRNQIKLLKGF